MAKGNNRAGEQPRASFQQAGGSIIKFRHPYLTGMLGSGVDTIDVSACVKLDGRYFEATANQDSAYQTVMIDGSVVTITNSLLNGTISMPVIRTTGLVGTGDFLACLHLIRSIGDSVGGILTKTDFVNGKAITKLYYGVTVKTVPDDISEGNAVAEYPVQLYYAGWIEAASATDDVAKKAIWAVGDANGLSAYFTPYEIQNSDGNSGTGTSAISGDTYTEAEYEVADDTAADNNTDNDGKDVKNSSNATPSWLGDVAPLPSSDDEDEDEDEDNS